MNKELSLYIHIPFCKRKCLYCDFLSAPAEEEMVDRYVQALLMEIRAYKDSELTQRKVQTIFIGGGTPSYISTRYIKMILSEIKRTFNISDKAYKQLEISMEVNPGTVDEEKCRAYYELGVNRISIGLQSTSNEELKRLGRIHTYEDFMLTYKMVKKVGFQNINVDLMSALPGQTVEGYKAGLEKIVALHPEHISAYSLIIEEGTPFYALYGEKAEKIACSCNQSGDNESTKMTCLPLPSEDDERKMYEITSEILSRYGYDRYEISNYAKKGQECQHNKVYWQRGDYLGFGIGAASFVSGERFSNLDSLELYIKYQMSFDVDDRDRDREVLRERWYQEQEMDACSEYRTQCLRKELCKLNIGDEMEEFMFLGLRLMQGVSEKEFFTLFQQPMDAVYGDVIQKNIKLGLLSWNEEKIGNRHLSLTNKGIDVSNGIFAQFLL